MQINLKFRQIREYSSVKNCYQKLTYDEKGNLNRPMAIIYII